MTLLSGPRKIGGLVFSDGKEVGTTCMCPHCGKHFHSVPGSGTRRSFCTRCMRTSCGSRECDTCIPFEERLDVYEKPQNLKSSRYEREIRSLISSGGILL